MVDTFPKLRATIVIRQQEVRGEKSYVVKDTESGNFFRLGEAEEFIVRQLDGETSLSAICGKVKEKYGEELDPGQLSSFVRDLKASGIVEGAAAGRGKSKKRKAKKRLIGNLLFLRFRIFDPTWIFDRLQPRISFLFSHAFVVLSAVAILVATDVAISNAGDIASGLGGLWKFSTILPYVAMTLLTIGLHEFGHGLTCRRFGGEVHEIGFLLIYFQPAFYCNVSDAWLFPEKSKRLLVSFAGPYFELFIWALAVFVWRVTEPGTGVNECSLLVIAISGLKTFLNFNPLIKLDGYYVLSDFLEIPNLRQKSFQEVGRLLTRRGRRRKRGSDAPTTRERRIYLTYGLIAIGGSLFIILSLVTALFRNISPELGMIFAVPLLFALAIRLHRMFNRLFQRGAQETKKAAVETKAARVEESVSKEENKPAAEIPVAERAEASVMSNYPHPKLRSDLVTQWKREGGAPVFVVKDKIFAETSYFSEAEEFLLRSCDGQTPVEEICRKFADRFGEKPQVTVVQSFVRDLQTRAILESKDLPPSVAVVEPERAKTQTVPAPRDAGPPLQEQAKPIDGKVRNAYRWPKRIGWAAVMVFAVRLVGLMPAELKVTGPFSVLPVGSTDIRSNVEGTIEQVFVKEGDRISAGQVIAMLSDRELRAQLEEASSQTREYSAKLRLLEAGASAEEVGAAQAAVASAASQVTFAGRKVERTRLMVKEGLLAQSAADDIEGEYAKTQGALAEAKAHLAQVMNSVRPQQLDEVKAQIQGFDAKKRLILKQMDSLRVLSPVTGIVATPQRLLTQLAGQFTKKGDALIKVFDFTSVRAQIVISEKEISAVKIGQPIALRARAYPDLELKGKVTFIATSANDSAAGGLASSAAAGAAEGSSSVKPVNTILVNTEIENQLALLKPEMTGQARIDCGRVKLAELMRWHLNRYLRVDPI